MPTSSDIRGNAAGGSCRINQIKIADPGEAGTVGTELKVAGGNAPASGLFEEGSFIPERRLRRGRR